MIFSCNRFAIIPHMCNECKRYIWITPYRRADVWKHDRFIMENICKQCLPKFLDVDITYNEDKGGEHGQHSDTHRAPFRRQLHCYRQRQKL